MWEGIRFSKSGCTSARTKINGQIHKDVETRDEVSESRFSMLASDRAKCAQEIPAAEFSAFNGPAAQVPTSPTKFAKVHFCQKRQPRTLILGASSNTKRGPSKEEITEKVENYWNIV